MFSFNLLLLIVPFAAFAMLRLYQRTGHARAHVMVAGLTFVISVIATVVAIAGFSLMWSLQDLAYAPVALWAMWFTFPCVVVTAAMALLLALKEWPIANLD